MKKIHFVCIGLLLLTLSCFTNNQYPGMKVRDRYLYTKDNERVILRGVNKMFLWQDIKGESLKEIAITNQFSIQKTSKKPKSFGGMVNTEKLPPIKSWKKNMSSYKQENRF